MKWAIIILLSISAGHILGQTSSHFHDLLRTKSNIQTFAANSTRHVIAPNLYTQYLGFFCRQELNMQKAHIPVTFRLGSMDYCNRLEQKSGYR